MERTIKKRSASKNVIKGLVIKINEFIDDENKRHEVERMMKTVEVKMLSVETMNESILDEIAEDQMENDMEQAAMFEIDIMKDLDRVKEKLFGKVKTEPDNGNPIIEQPIHGLNMNPHLVAETPPERLEVVD